MKNIKNVIFTIAGIFIVVVIFLLGCKIIDVNDPENMGIKSVDFVLDNSDALIGKEVMIKGYVAYVDETDYGITYISLVDSLSDINKNGERPEYNECIDLIINSEEANLKIGDETTVLCHVYYDKEIGAWFSFVEFVSWDMYQ